MRFKIQAEGKKLKTCCGVRVAGEKEEGRKTRNEKKKLLRVAGYEFRG